MPQGLVAEVNSESQSGDHTRLVSNDFGLLVGNYAQLKIHAFDIHERTSMDTRNRKMPFYVMSYMKRGSSTLRCRDRHYSVKDGQILIVPPQILHDHVMNSGECSTFLWWHFDLTIGGNLDVLRFVNEPMVFPVDDRDHFESQFIAFTELNLRKANTFSAHLLRRAKALELLAYLFENASILNYVSDRFGDVPDDFIAMLHDLVEEPGTYRRVHELADKYHYHPSYVANRFRHFFGVTPSKLGRNLLYEKAQVLIRSRDISMEEVAFQLGFSEPSSFTRFFKSVEGISPSSLRKTDFEEELVEQSE